MIEHYTKVIKEELAARSLRNSRYSMRAFSRDLGISPARMSRILSGKAAPSQTTTKKIGEAIGFQEEKLTWFCALVEASHGRTQTSRKAAQEVLSRYENGVSTKNIIVENSLNWNWHHFAIRRMTQLTGFQSSCEWISRRLGLGLLRVRVAVEELDRVGALSIIDGQMDLRENYSVYFKGNRQEVRKKMECDLFSRSLPSILSKDRTKAHHARHYFALNHEQVNELKTLIKSFEDQVDHLTYKTQGADDLFCLSLDFWSLLNAKPEASPSHRQNPAKKS